MCKEGAPRESPSFDISKPRSSELCFLSAAEVRQLAEAIDPHYRLLVYAAAYTGLRAGELPAYDVATCISCGESSTFAARSMT